MHVRDAIDAPRLHVDGRRSTSRAACRRRRSRPWEVNRWEGLNLFFGGVQAVELRADGALEAAGDPRRGGVGLVVV